MDDKELQIEKIKLEVEVAKAKLEDDIKRKKIKEESQYKNLEKFCKNYLNNDIDFVNKVSKYLPETFYNTDLEELEECIRIEFFINGEYYFFAFNHKFYNILLKGKNMIKARGDITEELYSEIYNMIVLETESFNKIINENGNNYYSIIIKNDNEEKIFVGNIEYSVIKKLENIKSFILNTFKQTVFEDDNSHRKFQKELFDKYQIREKADFALELYSGVPGLSDDITIEIHSFDFNNPATFNIDICGESYNEKTYMFKNIKSIVEEYLDKFIILSKIQNKDFLSENSYAGGGTSIYITYGNLNIYVNGQVYHEETLNLINEFKNRIKDLMEN